MKNLNYQVQIYQNNARHYPYIDSLRGLAILMVIIHHTNQLSPINAPIFISKLLSNGTRGVQLFFILSAFTLFLSFARRNSSENHPILFFFIRRFFRIAPLYYLAIIYYSFSSIYNFDFWFGTQPIVTKYMVFSNLIFLNGLSPYWANSLVPGGWSIGVEMIFYGLFPFLFYRIATINDAIKYLIFSLIIKFLFQEILLNLTLIESNYAWREYLFYYFPSQLPVFFMGFVLYFIIEHKNVLNEINSKYIIAFIPLLILQIGSRVNDLYFNHLLFSLAFLGIIYTFYTFYGKKFRFRFLEYIGKISYSMYIMHFLIITLLKSQNLVDFSTNWLINYIIVLAINLFLTVVVSMITYRIIELPFQNISKSIISKLSNGTK